MTYRLSGAAAADLEALYWSGADQFGAAQADRYASGIVKALEFIGSFPTALREWPELGGGLRVHRFGAHVILYETRDDGTVILRIRHGREDWTRDPL